MRSLLFGAIAICLLLWVAFYNGYPTVYPDTGSYLYTGAFFKAFPPFRAPVYSVFTRLTSVDGSAWFTVVLQAIIVVAVLYETCKYAIPGDSKFRDNCLLAIVCVLAALTSLPWEASMLMPDVFAAVVFLSAFLLAFDGELRLAERIALAVILAISVSAHMSLFPIAAVFVAVVAISRLAGWRLQGAPSAKSTLAWLLVPILVAGLGTATLNRAMGLGFKLSASGHEFLLASLFGDGLAADFLRENCPREPFIACRYLDHLPRTASEFLFYHPLQQALDGHEDEIEALARGTIAAYPVRFVAISIKETLRQLVRIRTGDEVRDLALHARNSNAEAIQIIYPRDVPAFSQSKLTRGLLVPLARVVAAIDTVAFWLSMVACVFFVWTKRVERLNVFLYSTVTFLVINAAVSATLAGVYDRYQTRVAWLVPLCFAFYVCCLVRERKHPQS